MNRLLRVEKLTLSHAGRCLVRDLELCIKDQECWMILGPNGSGKTTLLKTLCGLTTAQTGRIQLCGQPLNQLDARARAQCLGLVFQHGSPGLHNSILELVMSGHHPHRQHWWDTPAEFRAAREALRAVGLDALEEQPTQTLSGGELRRAEIARLLVHAPSLALLDEPFNHLDIGQQVAMVHLLKQRFQQPGKALLMAAHDLNLVTQVASHCLLLHGDGRWLAGTVEKIAKRSLLSELFRYPLAESRGPNGPIWSVDWER